MIYPFLPDLLLLALAFLVLFLSLITSKNSSLPRWAASSGLIVIFTLLNLIPINHQIPFLFSTWKIDAFGLFIREFLIFAAFLGISLSKNYFNSNHKTSKSMLQHPEFIALILFATLGGFVVVSASDLLTLFLGLELATIPLYALSAWNKKDILGSEAATKFILMGSVANAFELFGFSYLYGFSGSIFFTDIIAQSLSHTNSPLLWIAVLFLFAGIGFKLTLFPFHTWAPDVYEGSPTPVTAVLSVTSKGVAIAFMAILIYGPLKQVHLQIMPIIALLAGTTLVVGNLVALKQHRLRRFMAYSSIAQAGYLLLALLGPASLAKPAIVYYLLVYTAANFTVFFIISVVERTRSASFNSLRGLSAENPFLAISLAIALFSLAGIPPLAGFLGKFQLFLNVAHAKYYGFLVFAVLNNVIALYYYIQVLKSAWVDPQDSKSPKLQILKTEKAWIALLSVFTLVAGLLPIINDNIFKILQSF